jgi:hypothetical protein
MLIKLSITKLGSTCLRFTLQHKKGATAVAPKHENILSKKTKKTNYYYKQSREPRGWLIHEQILFLQEIVDDLVAVLAEVRMYE